MFNNAMFECHAEIRAALREVELRSARRIQHICNDVDVMEQCFDDTSELELCTETIEKALCANDLLYHIEKHMLEEVETYSQCRAMKEVDKEFNKVEHRCIPTGVPSTMK